MSKQNSKQPVVSVVIPSFNSEKVIRIPLDALRAQKTDIPFEVIVVDSSTDRTPEIVRREYPEVKFIHLDSQTFPGTARNYGIHEARGQYIAFTDTDCQPRPDWIEKIVATFEQVDADAIGGSIINGYPRMIPAWVNHLIEFNEWTETTPAGYVNNIPSANLIYKKETYEKFNEYYPDFLGSEDTLKNWRMTRKGGRLYFNPEICVVHMNRVDLKKLFWHQYNLGRWSAEARRTEDLPGNIFARMPRLMFLLPFARWVRAFSRLARKDLPKLGIFLLTTPLYLAAVTAWTVGFNSKKPLTYNRDAFKPPASASSKSVSTPCIPFL